jgi:hypothetical protein
MDWVNQLKHKLKVFIHDHAIELGLPHMAGNSQLFSLFIQGQSVTS